MKIGLSLYSLAQAINKDDFDFISAVHWAAEKGAEHLEVVPNGKCVFSSAADPMIKKLKKESKKCGIDLSSYTIGANFVTGGKKGNKTVKEIKDEIKRVKGQVDIAAALGVRFMRHDAAWRPAGENTLAQFEKDLPIVAEACAEIADYAKPFGITTSIENHGFHFQGSERVQRLVLAVNRKNFRTTMDVGNFCCVDEDPYSAVMNNLPFASFIHFKDFVIRNTVPVTNGWIRTSHGRYIRGSVTGYGDLDLTGIAKLIKNSGYSGYISIEYEGPEECKGACETALKNVKQLFDQQ